MSIGFRVFTKRNLPPKELIEAYKALPAANIADCMGRLSALNSEIRLMNKPFSGSMAGPALTVKTRPGDNLMLHKALNMAVEGDVIIVSDIRMGMLDAGGVYTQTGEKEAERFAFSLDLGSTPTLTLTAEDGNKITLYPFDMDSPD